MAPPPINGFDRAPRWSLHPDNAEVKSAHEARCLTTNRMCGRPFRALLNVHAAGGAAVELLDAQDAKKDRWPF